MKVLSLLSLIEYLDKGLCGLVTDENQKTLPQKHKETLLRCFVFLFGTEWIRLTT